MTFLVNNNDIVVPGERLAVGEYRIGEGVFKEGDSYYSNLVGIFTEKEDTIRVRSLKSRYYPKVGDKVIGYIEDVNLTSWIVNIRGPYDGVLLASNAVRGRFDPIKDDTRRIFDVGDVIIAEVISFDRTRDPMLATKYPKLGKLEGGRIVEVAPNHVPRIIGKGGSMVSMIKKMTNTSITIAQNGRIWLSAPNLAAEEKALKAINQITREAHVSGLTDRIQQLLSEE